MVLKRQYNNDIENEIRAQVIYRTIEKSNFLNEYKYLLFRAKYVYLIANHFKSYIGITVDKRLQSDIHV